MKSIFNLFIIISSLLFVMCDRSSDGVDSSVSSSDDMVALQFSFTPEDAFTLTSSSDTRATTENVVENELLNIWLLLFDENGDRIDPASDEIYCDDGVTERLGKTQDSEIFGSTYIDPYESMQLIYVNKSLSSKIRAIRAVANTVEHHDDFLAKNCPDLATYNTISFKLEDNAYRESDMWIQSGDEYYLRMAGNWDGTIPENGLDFNLAVLAKPIAAKITVSYECFDETVGEGVTRMPSTIDVTSVQVSRVPQNCYYRDVEDNSLGHDHKDFTSYQPRYVYDKDYLKSKEGEVSFYVPQNMAGTAGSSSENIAEEDKNLSNESLKTLYHADDATCVIITGLYTYWDEEAESAEKKYVYIQLYPGENNSDNYDVKLRHEYHMTCTITADADTVKWNTDYRVTLSEVLPEGAVVHYEFDPDNLSLNSAYSKYDKPLCGYPNTELKEYTTYYDNVRNSENLTDDTKTKNSYYYTHDENGYFYAVGDQGAYDLVIDGLDDYYDRYIYGFSGTTNAIADAAAERPFLRNLAGKIDDDPRYNNEDWHNPYYPAKNHPEIFDCTHIKDNFGRYTDKDLTTGYKSGVLAYYYPNNYINSSFLQLSTGWGAGLNPHEETFTIVFIGSLGVNDQMSNERGVYYGNSLEWNKRWYFYRNVAPNEIGNVTYGLGDDQTIAIDALYAESKDNVQSYDICNEGSRKVYFNNVDVTAISAATTVDKYNTTTTFVEDRPSTSTFIFDAPISIFGHTSDDNRDDAIDGKLRLFLIYDRVLDLDEIDQIRRYAALKGLLLYGEVDNDGFNVVVTPEMETAWDTEIEWVDVDGGDVTFGTDPNSGNN